MIPPINILDEIDQERDRQYNHWAIGEHGSPDPEHDDFLETYDLCRSFEVQNEEYCQKQNSVYVGDDGFPDSFNHQAWVHNTQKYDTRANQYIIAASQDALMALKILKKARELKLI
jgi:hypothetical protein